MLTDKQELFAQCVADGLTQADAYRAAYPASKDYKASTVWENASRMMADSKVLARVAELRQALADKKLWTREKSVMILAEIAEEKASGATARVSAVKELNAMHGFNEPIKVEQSGGLTVKIIHFPDE